MNPPDAALLAKRHAIVLEHMSAEKAGETQLGLSREGQLSRTGDIQLLQAAVLVAEVVVRSL